ncbi:MAG: sensor domain-containing diguanylate cyclase [Porticoccaceae bacterium]
MNLKVRFLLLAALLIVVASLSSWWVFERIAEGTVERWGLRFAEIQVRYDSVRMLKPLEREITLARQMADSNILKAWALNPDAQVTKDLALAEMESFRRNFHSGSYFVVMLDSGAYYRNNAGDDFAGRQLRLHLSPDNPRDAWFYAIVAQGRDFTLNISLDAEAQEAKLWVSVLMRDGQRVLGVAGTGIELAGFFRDFVDIGQPGVTTLFVDHSGAVQLYRDPAAADPAFGAGPGAAKKTVDLLLDDPEDRRRLQRMMAELKASPDPEGQVRSDFVVVGGQRYLAGIAYLPGIDWYEITLLDLDVLMPLNNFTPPVALTFALTLLISLLLVQLALRRYLLNPMAQLEKAMIEVRDGNLHPQYLPEGKGEMGRLVAHFRAMAEALAVHTEELEDKVQERTEALHQLARVDALTGLINRRGMTELLTEQVAQAEREGRPFGVLWCDVDDFKELNDSRGHVVGDLALCEVARLLRSCIRPYEHPGRWGGDEFLVLLAPCDRAILATIAERARSVIEAEMAARGLPVTISVGACLAEPGESVESILQRADEALYAAKAGGRNLVRIAAEC